MSAQQLDFDLFAPAATAAPVAVAKPEPASVHAYWWATKGGMHGDWWRALPETERQWWEQAYEEAKAQVKGGVLPGPEEWEKKRGNTYNRAIHRTMAMGFAMAISTAFSKGAEIELTVRKGCEWVLEWAIGLARVTEEFQKTKIKTR